MVFALPSPFTFDVLASHPTQPVSANYLTPGRLRPMNLFATRVFPPGVEVVGGVGERGCGGRGHRHQTLRGWKHLPQGSSCVQQVRIVGTFFGTINMQCRRPDARS